MPLLTGLGGAVFGVWSAHAQGKFEFSLNTDDPTLIPIRYVDPVSGEPTERYPSNPNGSPGGCAAVCSPDGRHLAIMPHPERAFLSYQQPWAPATDGGVWQPNAIEKNDGEETGVRGAAWMSLFHNAFDFAERGLHSKKCE